MVSDMTIDACGILLTKLYSVLQADSYVRRDERAGRARRRHSGRAGGNGADAIKPCSAKPTSRRLHSRPSVHTHARTHVHGTIPPLAGALLAARATVCSHGAVLRFRARRHLLYAVARSYASPAVSTLACASLISADINWTPTPWPRARWPAPCPSSMCSSRHLQSSAQTESSRLSAPTSARLGEPSRRGKRDRQWRREDRGRRR